MVQNLCMKPPKEDVPAGYELDCFCIPCTTLLSNLKLLLPLGVIDELWEESKKNQAFERDRDDEKAKIESYKTRGQADKAEYGLPEDDDKKVEDIIKKSDAIFSRRSEFNTEDVRTVLEYRYETEAKPEHSVQIYAPGYPAALVDQMKMASDSDVKEKLKLIIQRLVKQGAYRKISSKPIDLLIKALDQLGESQPHFSDVVEFIRGHSLLSKARDKPLKIPPILLFGPPGVGKTHFTQDLAHVIESPMVRHGLDSSTTDSSLVGTDKHWGNTHHGILFDTIVMGDFADPVILLDEIDKAVVHEKSNPLGPLHTLLEPVTSKKAIDISIGFEFDASHIVWIATANYPLLVPSTIRSRFTEFFIEPPSGADALTVSKTISDSVYKSMNLPDFEKPGSKIYHLLAHLVAREQRQALEQAYASAVANARTYIVRTDFPADILLDDEDKPGQVLH